MLDDFVSVEEAKSTGLIPEPFVPYFADTCEYCGGNMIINYAATVMKCGNPGCFRRVGCQASDLLHDLGYKEVGPATLTAFCKAMNIKSIVDFIDKYPQSYSIISTLNNMHLSYPKLVELLHIPFLGKKVYTLFEGCNNFSDFIKQLQNAQDPEAFMIYRAGGPVLAHQITEILTLYKADLEGITKLVNTSKQANTTVLIAITGHLTFDGGCTKDEFVYMLNELTSPIGVEFRRSDALKSVTYIVADTPSNSRKYRIGLERGNLIDSNTLYLAAKQIVEERNSNV